MSYERRSIFEDDENYDSSEGSDNEYDSDREEDDEQSDNENDSDREEDSEEDDDYVSRSNFDGDDTQEDDSDNPDSYEGPEDFDRDYVLRWIREEQDIDEDGYGEYEDYPELDCQEIVNRTEGEDLQYIISELLKEDIENNNNGRLDVIKELISLADIEIDDIHLLNERLEQAVREEDNDVVEFLREQGASDEVGIEAAIVADSLEMLEFFEPDTNDEYVNLAADNKSYAALRYFLEQDFNTYRETILDIAIRNSDLTLVEIVCENIDVEEAYISINYLVEDGGESLIPVFFDHFDIDTLLPRLRDQDDENNRLYKLVLGYAIRRLIESGKTNQEISELFATFDEKLIINRPLLIYPSEGFRGDLKLGRIRQAIDRDVILSDENRLAATLIGTPLSTASRHLTRSPYHQFPREQSETYHRSAKNPLAVFVSPKKALYTPKPGSSEAKAETGQGAEAHLGLYRHPLESLSEVAGVTPALQMTGKRSTHLGTSDLYDGLLQYKHGICQYIVNKLNFGLADAIKIGFYNNYPCVMVFIKKPVHAGTPSKASLDSWTEVVLSYFVGLVNYTAQDKGLDVEITRRSSFPFLTPTIAPCDQSLRISVGLTPREYADVLIWGLKILNSVLTNLNNAPPVIALPDDCFLYDSDYEEYMGEKGVPVADNLLGLIWVKAEKNGKTTVQNLTRTAFARQGLSMVVHQKMFSVPNSIPAYTQILCDALAWGIGNIAIQNGTLTFQQQGQISFAPLPLRPPARIEDVQFWACVTAFLSAVKREQQFNVLVGLVKDSEDEEIVAIEACITGKTVTHLYAHLEMVNELLYSRTIMTYSGLDDDGFGSDSEVEDETEEVPGSKIYGKKVIVQNGMRTILAAAQSSRAYLTHIKSPSQIFLHGPYYETPDALKLLNGFVTTKNILNTHILVCDINACVKDAKPLPSPEQMDISHLKVLIIDSTSATTRQHQIWVEKFRRQPGVQLLFFVSSGLKNEQGSADKNSYGTIRIFAKDKKILQAIMSFIKTWEIPIRSAISHHYRRMMKRMGHTPRNTTIAKPKDEKKAERKMEEKHGQPNIHRLTTSFGTLAVSSSHEQAQTSGLKIESGHVGSGQISVGTKG